MIQIFEGETANEAWQQAFQVLREQTAPQPGRGGSTRELLHSVFSIKAPRQRWVVSRDPPINPAFALAEVVWILNGSKVSSFLNAWNSQLPKYAGTGETYDGAYGFRLRQQFGFDQLERAYHALRNNPEGRQVVLQIWDPRTDLPDEEGKPVSPDIPCNIVSMLKVRNDKLEWAQIMRSNDLYLGTPHNFVQFTSLQEIMAGWLGVEVGSYTHWSDSLHLYTRDLRRGISLASVTPAPNTDSLFLPKDESEVALAQLYASIEALASPGLTEVELQNLCQGNEPPRAYRNILAIMASEAARRRGWIDVLETMMTECTNPALNQAFERWLGRFN